RRRPPGLPGAPCRRPPAFGRSGHCRRCRPLRIAAAGNPMVAGEIDGVSFIGQVLQWFLDGSHWQGDFGIPNRLFEHLYMSAASLAVAALIALPIGVTIGHIGRGGHLALNVANVGCAVPSFALLVFAAQLVGMRRWPARQALVALGSPPMFTKLS